MSCDAYADARQVSCSSASSMRTLASFAGSVMRADLISRIVILSTSSPGEIGTLISTAMQFSSSDGAYARPQ